MDLVVLVARVLLVAIFVGAGLQNLTLAKAQVADARAKGVPFTKLSVFCSGVLALFGGLSVLLGAWGDLGALVLIAFLVPSSLLMHAFWTVRDPADRHNETAHFMKNTSMTGGALVVFVLFAYAGPDLGLTLTDPVFQLR